MENYEGRITVVPLHEALLITYNIFRKMV